MKLIKTILHNFTLLNLSLLAILVILFFSLAYPLINEDVKIAIPKPKAVRAQDEKKPVDNNTAYSDYFAVIDKNLFHPERMMPADKREEKQIVRPEIILYGTLITSEKKIAYIEDKKNPFSTTGRRKRQVALALGSAVGGYTLQEVNPESITLVHGEDKMVINLRDQKDRKYGESISNLSSSVMMPPQVFNQMKPALLPSRPLKP